MHSRGVGPSTAVLEETRPPQRMGRMGTPHTERQPLPSRYTAFVVVIGVLTESIV